MDHHPLHRLPLSSLFTATGARSRRASSWDRSGGNLDFLMIGSGDTAVLLEHDGPGCVTHLYCALAFPEVTDYRDAILRCFERVAALGEPFYAGRFEEALRGLRGG